MITQWKPLDWYFVKAPFLLVILHSVSVLWIVVLLECELFFFHLQLPFRNLQILCQKRLQLSVIPSTSSRAPCLSLREAASQPDAAISMLYLWGGVFQLISCLFVLAPNIFAQKVQPWSYHTITHFCCIVPIVWAYLFIYLFVRELGNECSTAPLLINIFQQWDPVHIFFFGSCSQTKQTTMHRKSNRNSWASLGVNQNDSWGQSHLTLGLLQNAPWKDWQFYIRRATTNTLT